MNTALLELLILIKKAYVLLLLGNFVEYNAMYHKIKCFVPRYTAVL